ncbi:MAG: tRNA uridine-5-carboxymethylaminomethyl(34) synthesis GTPase MnmE [Bauldia sp.]|nr:tRNA uridine-5-carboxymethylaminomethyl(34) synthesis GTPase MnmE [Bauldia sp.]
MDLVLPTADSERTRPGSVDTIFALASGAPPAGIAIVRVSGPGVRDALGQVANGVPEPRVATLRPFHDPGGGSAIDEGLVLFFPGPGSFTGEDVAEFHLHGGRAVVAALLDALAALPGFRPAERGEFTRRAFLAGRVDLTQAEALADLVAAETAAQRSLALEGIRGSIRTQYESWRRRLIEARALIEASIDFADEEDVGEAWTAEARADVARLRDELAAALAGHRRGERIREGAEVVILGAPNVGKSSLLNALAGRDAAIVSREAGTTRDLIEVTLDVAGYRVTLVDTAGMRDTESEVEREGIRRAEARAAEADLVLWLSDRRDVSPPAAAAVLWAIATKADLMDSVTEQAARRAGLRPVSAVTGQGVDALLADLGAFLSTQLPPEPTVMTRQRHAVAVAEAAAGLDEALGASSAELVAEGLRVATAALGRVTGAVDVEDVLDVVFASFCIGK